MTKNVVKASRIFLAVMFLFSGISKLLSMAFFDAMVAELFLGPSYYDNASGLFYTQLLSRILISAELVLGVAVLIEWKLKKITLPALGGMLLLFTIHLFYEGLTSDKGFIEGNCGCFGDVLPMNNLESIIKNVIGLVAVGIVWLKHRKEEVMAPWILPLVTGLVTMATLSFGIKDYSINENNVAVIVNQNDSLSDTLNLVSALIIEEIPVDTVTKQVPDEQPTVKVETPKPTQTENKVITQINAIGKFSDGSKLSVAKGEHVVCLFSMTCGHCQESYKEICEMTAYAKMPNIHLVNYGKDFEQKYFFNQAGGCQYPYIRTEDYTQFNRLLEGKGFPRVMVFKDGKVVKDWNIDTYNRDVFMEYFKIEEKKEESDGLNLQKKDDDLDLGGNPWD